MTAWVGSWTFILSLLFIMAIWMAVNMYAWINVWDPYPFILLNFVLSTIAALQAPVIMMSQNRQAEIDRRTALYDFEVDKRAEAEIANMQRDLEDIKAMIKALDKKISKKK